MKDNLTIGISAYFHDSAVALSKNGKIIFAIQEERLSRIKNDESFPIKAIKKTLEYNNLKISDIDSFVFYEKPFIKFERLLETYLSFAPRGIRSFSKFLPSWVEKKLLMKETIFKELRKIDKNFKDKKKIYFSSHHLSHAASVYYLSGMDEALILNIDGVGEWNTTSIMKGSKNIIESLEEINFPHSIGLLYSAFTFFCGFEVNNGEYKLMGLAPYGEPKHKDKILNELIHLNEDGSFNLNMKYFDYCSGLKMTNKNFDNLFGAKPREIKDKKIDQIYIDIASSIQIVLEEIIFKILKYLKNKYQIKNLCMSGGVALNCAVNGKIVKEKIFEKVFIAPASGDAGGAIGAALAFDYLENKSEKIYDKQNYLIQDIAYLGTEYSSEKIKKFLLSNNIPFEEKNEEELINFTSEKLIEKKIIGWFQGRMEFGPRALGSRSILADPRIKDMQKEINMKIKFREGFRPFAPVILFEYLNEWFEFEEESPFMLFLAKLRKDKIKNYEKIKLTKYFEKSKILNSDIPAIVHVDFTSRLQTVKRDSNRKLYDLIENFKNKTGIPMLVNTSFNIKDEPIVENFEDAYKCFMTTNLDYLIMNNFIIFREQN